MRAAALSQLSWAQSVQNLPVSLGGSDPTLLEALTLHLPERGRQGRVTQEWPGKKVLTPPGAPLDMLVTLHARPSHPTPQEPVWEGMWKAYRGEGRARRPRRPGPQGAGRDASLPSSRRASLHHASLPPAPALGSRRGGRSPHPPAWASRTPQLQPPPPSAGPGAAVTGAGVAAARARPPAPRPGHLTVPPWPAPALATGDSAAMTAGTPTRASPQDMES